MHWCIGQSSHSMLLFSLIVDTLQTIITFSVAHCIVKWYRKWIFCVCSSAHILFNQCKFFHFLFFLRLNKFLVTFLLLLDNAFANSHTYYPFRICWPRTFLKSIHHILKHLAYFCILKPNDLGSIQQLSGNAVHWPTTNKDHWNFSLLSLSLKDENWQLNGSLVARTERLVKTVNTIHVKYNFKICFGAESQLNQTF